MFLVDYMTLELGLILIPIILSFIAQAGVDSAYTKGNKINVTSGKTGAEIAQEMLMSNGISDVRIKMGRGYLTDHYNPSNKTLSLSKTVYELSSASSVAIAAHEVGHAIQHAEGYGMLKVRNSMVGVTNFANSISWVLIMIGLLLGMFDLALVGVGLFSIVALFQLVTLPVELDASRRAYEYLSTYGVVVESDEKRSAKKVLKCAAFTYVVALITSIAQIVRLVLVIVANRDD
jgi:Zn-dependent membrane protease YugP